jgi:hypothetical protein
MHSASKAASFPVPRSSKYSVAPMFTNVSSKFHGSFSGQTKAGAAQFWMFVHSTDNSFTAPNSVSFSPAKFKTSVITPVDELVKWPSSSPEHKISTVPIIVPKSSSVSSPSASIASPFRAGLLFNKNSLAPNAALTESAVNANTANRVSPSRCIFLIALSILPLVRGLVGLFRGLSLAGPSTRPWSESTGSDPMYALLFYCQGSRSGHRPTHARGAFSHRDKAKYRYVSHSRSAWLRRTRMRRSEVAACGLRILDSTSFRLYFVSRLSRRYSTTALIYRASGLPVMLPDPRSEVLDIGPERTLADIA